MALAAVRIVADDAPASGAAALYLGIAGIVSAATGLIAAVTALVRVLRAPVRHDRFQERREAELDEIRDERDIEEGIE